VMPALAVLFLLVAFSSMGVPGLNGFVGELLILIGSFKASVLYGSLATIGLVLGAVYLLWMYKRVMYGDITKDENKKLKDMTGREFAYLLPIILFIVWIGVYPKPFLDKMDASVQHLLQVVNYQESIRTEGQKNIWLNTNYANRNPEQFAADQRR
jgi:NADH-quinone oxidoreductase subunit M